MQPDGNGSLNGCGVRREIVGAALRSPLALAGLPRTDEAVPLQTCWSGGVGDDEGLGSSALPRCDAGRCDARRAPG